MAGTIPAMIVPARIGWFRTLVYWKGTALRRTWGRILLVTLVAGGVTYAHEAHGLFFTNLTTTPFSLVGLALSIFLGFRNNTSYDRYWEGRKLWGALVNESRSLARRVRMLVGAPGQDPAQEGLPELHRKLVYRVIAYVHALRVHLRGAGSSEQWQRELGAFLPEDELQLVATESNPPAAIARELGLRFREAWEAGHVDAFHLPELERGLTRLLDIQGGCERIKATPIPFSYTVLIHRIVAVYCFSLPFGLVDSITVFTPVVVTFVAYAFFGLDALGDEIEEPFGTDNSDLPLQALSTMIEVNLRETLGERSDLPALHKPVGDVLS